MKTVLNVKTDKEVKEQARQVAEELGLPLSSVVNALLKQFIRDREISFSLKEYKATPYLEELIAEAHAERERGDTVGPFDSVDDLMESLNS